MPLRRSPPLGTARTGATIAALSVLILTGAAQAQTAPGAKASFPPFDATTFAGQFSWLAISFGVLYWLMSTIALPRVGAILEERAGTISRDLDNAAQMQAKAEETAKAYENALAEARTNAQGIAQAARDAGAKASDARRHVVEAELAARLTAAEAAITSTKTAAMKNVRGLGSEVAIAIVAKLTGQSPTASEAAEAVDRALARG